MDEITFIPSRKNRQKLAFQAYLYCSVCFIFFGYFSCWQLLTANDSFWLFWLYFWLYKMQLLAFLVPQFLALRPKEEAALQRTSQNYKWYSEISA